MTLTWVDLKHMPLSCAYTLDNDPETDEQQILSNKFYAVITKQRKHTTNKTHNRVLKYECSYSYHFIQHLFILPV
jgi:hypothetical protein